MAALWSSEPSPAAAAPASAMEDASNHWAPHGTVLTACVVSINVLVILVIFFFFCRFFSGKQGPSASSPGGEDDDTLPVASPWASRRSRNAPRPPPEVDVASFLPVYVYSSAGAGRKGAVECAVCIVELRDGDTARQLPRCGHRFHADCVGAWLRLHATCPLCRASVIAPVAAAAGGGPMNPKDAAAVVGAGCPV